MNFANVKEWLIPEGDVKKVTDSQGRIIWQKDTYIMLDFVYANTNKTGIIVPLDLIGGTSYEIGMDFQYVGSNPSSIYAIYDIVNVMGNWNAGLRNNNKALFGVGYGGGNLMWNYWDSTTDTNSGSRIGSNTNSSHMQSRHKVIMSTPTNTAKGSVTLYNEDGSQYGTLNNTTYNLTYNGTNQFRDIHNYWGFGVFSDENGNVKTNPGKFTGYIYECWIKVGEEYTHHLLPALQERTGKYGLYDTVDGNFYPSCTENEFTIPNIPVTGLSLTSVQIPVGSSKKIVSTFTPVYASNRNLTWSSSDTTVATVDSNGNVTGVGTGTATISATTTDGTDITATCTASVYIGTTGISISPSRVYLNVGGSATLTPTVSPANATYKTVTWQIRNNGGGGGSVTLVKNSDQTATITAETARTYDTLDIRAQAYNGQWSGYTRVYITEQVIAVTSVTLNKSSESIGIGGQLQLVATIQPDNATSQNVVWTTSNSSIATVTSNGLVTGIAEGVATITASCGGKSATCTVTVVPPPSVESVDIPSALILQTGETQQINPTVSPSTVGAVTYSWSSSDNSVATVSSSGVITAVSAGNATITCTVTGYGGSTATDTCTVIVQAEVRKYSYTVSCDVPTATVTFIGYGSGKGSYTWTDVPGTNGSWTVTATNYQSESGSFNIVDGMNVTRDIIMTPIAVENITVNPHTLTLDINETYTLTASVEPSDALNKTITWSSSNTNIATVNSSGKVTAKAAGTATITGSSNNGCTDTCALTVSQPSTVSINKTSVTLNIGESTTVTATASPNSISGWWESSNTNVVTVSPGTPTTITGTVTITAVGSGNATVSFKKSSGTVVSCYVTVLMPTKHISISNIDDNQIYYHTNVFSNDAAISPNGSTTISLNSGGALYIRTTDEINHTIDLSCISSYTISSGYYVITYANAVDGDDIDCFR